jgi:hypothetical protein
MPIPPLARLIHARNPGRNLRLFRRDDPISEPADATGITVDVANGASAPVAGLLDDNGDWL